MRLPANDNGDTLALFTCGCGNQEFLITPMGYLCAPCDKLMSFERLWETIPI